MEINDKEKVEKNGKSVANLTEEEINKIVLSILESSDTKTVEDAIAEKKEEDETIKESFLVTKKSCSNVLSYSNSTLIKLNTTILLINLLKIYSYIIQNGDEDLLNDFILKMQSGKNDIKSQQVLLKEIKHALAKLKRYKIVDCNLEICKLIAFIYEKQCLIVDELNNYIKACELNVKGIQYQGTNKNQEELKELNEIIDNSIKTLGLRK